LDISVLGHPALSLTWWLHPSRLERNYIEGRNVAIEYRWAEGKNERLPEMAADLVSRRVAVIAVLADIAVSAAKAKTMTIPIVFMTGGDPVREGFVASLNQPGGNITGASWFSVDPMAKRLEILHQVVPNAAVIAQLVDLNFQDSVSHVAEGGCAQFRAPAGCPS
jgi:putative tryptophan/tyrosine transport system substrate-binding protein